MNHLIRTQILTPWNAQVGELLGGKKYFSKYFAYVLNECFLTAILKLITPVLLNKQKIFKLLKNLKIIFQPQQYLNHNKTIV